MHEVAEKIWKSESATPGQTIIISGGIHGNERTGIEVVLRIKQALEQEEFIHTSGTLFLLLGNLKAIELNERWSESGVDLNRCFGEISEAVYDSFEAQRAMLIKKVLALDTRHPGSVIGIDLHATNKPSKPFLVMQPHPTPLHSTLFSSIPSAQALLCDPHWVFTGVPATLDDYYNSNRNTGFCYETGCADDTSRVNEVFNEMRTLLKDRQVIAQSKTPDYVAKKYEHSLPTYALREAIILSDQGFAYESLMGLFTFQEFSKGALLGHHGGLPLIASFDGVFIFPKLAKHWKLGEPVGFLAEKIKE